MADILSHSPPDDSLADAVQDRREAVLWHMLWMAAVLLSAIAIIATLGMSWPVFAALVCGAIPAAIGQLLAWRDGPRARALLIVLWSIGCAAACILSGGISGPLAVWCLAPVAAASVVGSGRLVAEAAALALLTAAMAALFQCLGMTPAPPSFTQDFWLGLTALMTTGLGLATGLLLAHRRADRRRIPQAAANDRVERLITEQPYLVVSLDAQGRIGSAFGFAPEGVPEARLMDEGLLGAAEPADRPRLQTALQAALSQGQAEAAFTPLGALLAACAVSIRRGADGSLVAVLRDASRERAREASLEAARQDAEQLNAGKSRFLANMSHELRTPLNAIMGFSDMMRARLFGPLTGKYGEYAELIHESGGHLLDLINDVLDMSKIEAERYQLSRELFDAREPVSAAMRLMRVQADDAGITLRGVLPSGDLEVDADRRALKQIVLNLVSNALKFTPRGGAVTVNLNGYDDRLELVVADTGVGIAPEDLQRLGRPYEQAGDADQRAKGAGLGLSLVRAFAELHGGEMVVESELGEGTSVVVRLPVVVHHRPAPQSAQVIAFSPQR